MINKNNWSIDEKEIPHNFFKNNIKYFPFNGGSIETLFSKIKIVHSKRVFGKSKNIKLNINKNDILNAFKLHKKYQDINEVINKPPFGIYC